MVRVQRWAGATWQSGATRWLLVAVAAVAVTGWAIGLRPVAPVWGPVGTWVAGLAIAAAVLFGGVQLRATRLEQRDEHQRRRHEEAGRREAMARSVSVTAVVKEQDDEWVVDYTIANGADFPVDDVVLLVADPDADEVRPQEQVGTCLRLAIGTLHHKEVVRDVHGPVRMKREPAFGEIDGLASVSFTDPWGQAWWRAPGEIARVEERARGC